MLGIIMGIPSISILIPVDSNIGPLACSLSGIQKALTAHIKPHTKGITEMIIIALVACTQAGTIYNGWDK